MSKLKFKKVKGTNSPNEKQTYGKCGKKHYGDSLEGTYNFFSYGKSGHKMRDFPNLKSQYKDNDEDQASGSRDAPKKNHLYVLRSRG